MRRLVVASLLGLGLCVAAVGGLWLHAHLSIRSLRPPLPEPDALWRVDAEAELPVALYVIETARQPMPRSNVIEASRDPRPDAPYVMTHVSFVLVWPDGRIFLFDAGMDRPAAQAFGEPLERYAGAAAIEPLGSVAEQLGDEARRVRGIAFSHLHTDHIAGLDALCASVSERIPVFQTRAQHDAGNYTTWGGRAQLEGAPCAAVETLEDVPLAAVPGFPGLHLIQAAGHTPGSQLLVARLHTADGGQRWIFTGDLVNHRDALAWDLPKPRLYSLLVVPEDTDRLHELRRYLAALSADPRVHLAVSHDASGLDAKGVLPWPGTMAWP